MIDFGVNLRDTFRGWIKSWPLRMRGVERRLQEKVQATAPPVMDEPKTEAEREVVAAMGWDGNDTVRDAVKAEL